MYYYPINYKTIGKGKSFVLFLHGWGGSTNSFLHVARKLENTCKTVLIDFYGFGKTKFPKVSLDTYEYTTQLYLFLKSKNIEEVSIVAHSFGGRVALILSSIFVVIIYYPQKSKLNVYHIYLVYQNFHHIQFLF